MKRRLEGKVAIVTGGATGIGEAISKKFAMEGAKVVICGLPDDPVDKVVKSILAEGDAAVAFKSRYFGSRKCQSLYRESGIRIWQTGYPNQQCGVFPAIKMLHEYPIEAYEIHGKA
jgi:NAD(P)-dependent dehydrogenase (short-subunit alcohol dehydrogenase family)